MSDSPAWDLACDTFMAHCGAEKGLAKATLEAVEQDLKRLRQWAAAQEINAPGRIRDEDLRSFLIGCSNELIASSRARLLSTLRSFFRFLVTEGLAAQDPTTTIAIPKRGRKLPPVLSVDQVVRLIETVQGTDPRDLRDRAILELLYGCGCRVSELCGLDVTDLDPTESTVLLRGKGRKQRLVPVGEPALEAVEDYLRQGRARLLGKKPTAAIFLNHRGGRLSRVSVWGLLKSAGREAGLPATMSPHTLRHSFATHLIKEMKLVK